MHRVSRKVVVTLFACAAALGAAACGNDDADDTSRGGKSGGTISIAFASQPDFLDPALSYTSDGWAAMWYVYLPPLTYAHAEGTAGAKLIPAAAEALPKVSKDRKVFTFKIRNGLEFSDGTPVKASDFEHTIRRVLTLESGAASYYEKIVGVPEYLSTGDAEGDISGIETDDASGQVKVRLTTPDGTFSNILALNFSGIVPGDTPFENQTKDPPPGTGSYTITDSQPNREFTLTKNANYTPIDGIPQGKAERLVFKIEKSVSRGAQAVLRGDIDVLHDPPPADLQAEIQAKHPDRYRDFTTQSTYFFFLNHALPPFDDERARQAVNAGIDKPALARLFGAGQFEPSCNFLPPGIPGYEKIDPCPWGDPMEPPDLDKARALLEEAGLEGAKVTVWAPNDDPPQKITEAYAEMLNEIGFDAEPKVIDGAVYLATVGNARTKAQTGFDNWFADFPHPANYLFLLNGKAIQPANSSNRGNVDDPELNREISELEQAPDVEAVADRWAAVDRAVVDRAHVAPYGQRKLTAFVSDRVDFENCVVIHPLYQTDYSQLCLK